MRTIHVIGSRGIPATWGGVERQCEELYTRLALKGFNITIFARNNYVKKDVKQYKGVNVIRLPTLPLKGFEAAIHTFLSTFVSLLHRPQIIHYYSQGPCLFSWIPRLLSPTIRVFFTCGGLDWQRKKWNMIESSIIRLGEIFSAIFPHVKIVVSKELQTYYKTKYKCETYYIPNGVNLPRSANISEVFLRQFDLNPKGYLLSVSRIVPEKRIEDLIEAHRISRSQLPLVIVGDSGGHTNDYFKNLKERAGTNKLIRFLGFRFGDELDQLFRSARCFITASELEGLPITLLEAMSYGLPCIASDIAPHREALGASYPFMFKVGDIQSIAVLIKELEELNLDELAKLSLLGLERVKHHYSWDNAVNKLEILYNKSLSRMGTR